MSGRLTITLGAAFFLLGLAGFVYLLARPRPPVVPGASDVLPFEQSQPSPTPTPEAEKPEQSPRPTPGATPIPRLAVKLVNPAMAQTFVAPATVTIEATAQPGNQISKVAFYATSVSSRLSGGSVCRSLNADWDSTLLTNLSIPIRIGETTATPSRLIWNFDTAGIYDLRAVATYRSGLQQISPPVVIVVNSAAKYQGKDWEGWRPSYPKDQIPETDPDLMPAPTPTPACPEIKVYTLNPSPSAGSLITFKAEVAGGDLDGKLQYQWTVVGGTIVGGKGTSSISVSTSGILDSAATVTVNVTGYSQICPATASQSVPITQPRWITDSVRTFLKQHVERMLPFAERIESKTDTRGYIVVYGESDSCLAPETIEKVRLLKKYLVDLKGVSPDRIILVHGPPGEEANKYVDFELEKFDYQLWIVPPGAKLSKAVENSRPMVACVELGLEPLLAKDTILNRKCPDLIENVRFSTSVGAGHEFINICPHNPGDPQNESVVTGIVNRSPTGRYGNFPTFNYWTNGGKIFGSEISAIWDLSDVKLRPGWHTAIVEADDGCDCSTVTATQVGITNFCTPCMTGGRFCREAGPENGKQVFVINIEDFATRDSQSYRWDTSAGTIIDGQGTQGVTIDTSHLAKGTKFLVTARVRGLRRYCVNKLSFEAVAGDPCGGPRAVVLDEYGSIRGSGGLAKRRKPETSPPTNIGDEETSDDSGTEPTRTPDESELIKVAWSPKVKTDESFSIVVNYNRVKDAVRISNQAGEIIEVLRSSGEFKLLKDKYGPDYRALANVRFESAGIDNSYCREQYQSLDNESVEWSCSVSPRRAGRQTFNVELWVKGEPRNSRSSLPAKEAEKVWSKNNLKIEVSAPLVTKTTVFASASLCVVIGLGLSLRWLRIYRIGDTYNVGQAVAVGRNVRIESATVNQNAQDKISPDQKGE